MEDSLINIGSKAVGATIKADSDQAEAFLTKTYCVVVEVEKGSVKHAYTVSDEGLSVKSVYRGSVGFSYATTLETKNVIKTAESASAEAKAGTPDPEFKSLPEPQKTPTIKGIYDKAIVEADPTDIIAIAVQLAESQKIDKRIYSVNSAIRCGWQQIAVVNSLGVECEDRSTLVQGEGHAIAKEHGEMSSGFEFHSSRSLREMDPSKIGRTAGEYAVRSLHPKKIKTATLPVVLDSIAASYIFLRSIMAGASAENIQYKRSYLCGKLGEKIGSSKLTVVDDGMKPNGAGSFRFDAEGTPSQKTTIMEKGVLESYIYDCYTAGKEGRESTGNAFRVLPSRMFMNYRGTPAIGVRNLIIKPGKGTVEDLVSEVKDGILLRATWDRPNNATGEFSGLIRDGFKIEDGEAKYATRQTNIGVNMIDFFKRIVTVGADSRQFQNAFMGPYCVVSPSIAIEKAMISGAK